MNRINKLVASIFLIGGIAAAIGIWRFQTQDQREPSKLAFVEHCADCHSSAGKARSLLEERDQYSSETLIKSIRAHHAELIQAKELSDATVKALALFISEQRQELPSIVESHIPSIPTSIVTTKLHNFNVELITEVGKGPYSIEPLPDGRLLLVEKVRGLSVIDADGNQGDLITGTPRVWSEIASARGSLAVLGSMLDVELHPDYRNNGWIYLSHSDRCQLDCGSPWPVTMVRVIRGRLEGNQWIDTEVIWSVDKSRYTIVPDAVASGRLAFDQSGFGYVTVGGKSTYDNLHVMDTPYGKIHRFGIDGTIPTDNPFWLDDQSRDPTSSRNSVFTYGHRTAQGLTTDPITGDIWSSEMGPRGGDEINLVKRGGNYGWPLYTEGLDYDGEYITIGEDLGLDFEFSETIPPVVDFTPAPSLSNLTFYTGEQFPEWQQDILIGSLRAQTLFRVRIREGQLIEHEKLLTKLGRIRDVEVGPKGFVYLLLEHGETGSLLRLVPVSS